MSRPFVTTVMFFFCDNKGQIHIAVDEESMKIDIPDLMKREAILQMYSFSLRFTDVR